MGKAATFKLVIDPQCSFAAVAAAVEALGMVALPDTMVAAPLVADEPEFAAWRDEASETAVHYSCNPVFWLRVLHFTGKGALGSYGHVGDALPALGPSAIADLLAATEPREQLLGLYAASELELVAMLPAAERLRSGSNRAVTAAAANTVESLTIAMLDAGTARLESLRKQHPDRSALFPLLGDAETRRRMLVALLDNDAGDEDIAPVLRSGLADDDWRVRITAMLVAVRLGASTVWPAVREMALPPSGSSADRHQRDVLIAARKASLEELAGEPPVPFNDEKSRLRHHLRAVVAGRAHDSVDARLKWLESFIREQAVDRSSSAHR